MAGMLRSLAYLMLVLVMTITMATGQEWDQPGQPSTVDGVSSATPPSGSGEGADQGGCDCASGRTSQSIQPILILVALGLLRNRVGAG